MTSTTDTVQDGEEGASLPDGCVMLFLSPNEPGGGAIRQIVNTQSGKIVFELQPGQPIPDVHPDLCDS